MPSPHRIASLAAVLCAAIAGVAAPAAAEPRELSADRPDVTESPYSVPPGWFQLEMDGVYWVRDSDPTHETTRVGVVPLNLKLGLASAFDLQVVFEPWVRTRVEFVGSCADESGGDCGAAAGTTTETGELAVRLKWNLIGNDGGRVAVGLLPWVAWNTNERFDGIADGAGLAVPLAVSLGERWGMGVMIEGSAGDEDDRAVLGSATVARDFGGSVGAFGEIVAEHAWSVADDTDFTLATANVGVTVAASPDLQFDTGVRVGISEDADGFAAFLGLTWRRKVR